MTKALEILRKYWKHKEFRALQQEIIQSVLDNKSTLAILPTGGGKSVCFQIPAMCMEGLCIVISPLVALMKDQVSRLKEMGIKSELIHGALSKREIDIILDNCRYGQVKFLYLSPERLKNELFLERSQNMNIQLIAVDEAHCISQWGFDFRPQYRNILEFIETKPDVKLIALTGSATKEVKKDIQERLGFTKQNTFQASFHKPNLNFVVRKTESKDFELLKMVTKLQGSGIVYCRSRNHCAKLSDFLNKNGHNTEFYHAGLNGEERDLRQENWQKNRTRIIVSTNAFGMGIDKSDVRFVIHYQIPESIESYYQECGRAGRDGKEAYAIGLIQEYDYEIVKKNHQNAHPSIQKIKTTYQALCNYYQLAIGSQATFTSLDFDLDQFCERYNLKKLETYNSLKKLQEAEHIELSDGFYSPSKLMILMNNLHFYEFSLTNPQFANITKHVLRIYGGELFSHHKKISESLIATQTKTSPDQVRKALRQLDQLEIIDYIESKDSPQLMFTSTRLSLDRLNLDKKLLDKRKNLDYERMQAISQYYKIQQDCRLAYILRYFNEKNAIRCGKCDICRNNKSSKESYKQEFQEILEHLKAEDLNLKTLFSKMNMDAVLFRELLLKLSDAGKISIKGDEIRSMEK